MRTIVSRVLAVTLGLIFIYAGFIKAIDGASFYREIRNYHLLPLDGAWYWAHFLPWLEIISGIGVLVASIRRAASIIMMGLLIVFIMAILSAWWRGLHIGCGCFGNGEPTSAWPLARDFCLLAAVLYVLSTTRALRPEPTQAVGET
jgi:putative oxidoreductase